MRIIPAIDLYQGACVRLLRGMFSEITYYSSDPAAVAQQFAADGAQILHIVDLEGGRTGRPAEQETVLKILRASGIKVQLGGGIRSRQTAEFWLNHGVHRVVLGSAAIETPETLETILGDFGPERCVLAVDVESLATVPSTNEDENNKSYLGLDRWYPKTQGWYQSHLERGLFARLLAQYQTWGGRYLLSTDIKRDGALIGPALDLYQEILRHFPTLRVIASGGVSALSDLKNLSHLPLEGVVLGRALFEKKIDLREAVKQFPYPVPKEVFHA